VGDRERREADLFFLERSLFSLILRPPLSLVLLAPSFHLSGTITFPSFFSPASQIPPTHLRREPKKKNRSQHGTPRAKTNRPNPAGETSRAARREGDLTLGAHHRRRRRRRFLCCSCGWDSGTGRGKSGEGGGGGSAGFRRVGRTGFLTHWARPETRLGRHTSCSMGPIRTKMLA
jgi:hypothetical protein